MEKLIILLSGLALMFAVGFIVGSERIEKSITQGIKNDGDAK
jgi:hypothetical protein